MRWWTTGEVAIWNLEIFENNSEFEVHQPIQTYIPNKILKRTVVSLILWELVIEICKFTYIHYEKSEVFISEHAITVQIMESNPYSHSYELWRALVAFAKTNQFGKYMLFYCGLQIYQQAYFHELNDTPMKEGNSANHT